MVLLPKTMQAVVSTNYGSPDKVVQIVEMPIPKPSKDEVLLKIYAASLNPTDWKWCRGHYHNYKAKKFPNIMGKDFAGVVVGLGSNITDIEMGQRVCGFIDPSHPTNGSMAEYMVCRPTAIHPMPAKMSFAEAASLPLVAQTVYQSLTENAHIKKGDKIVILGGSTACGLMATMIAKAFECETVLVTSRSEQLCKSVGADIVIDYTKYDWEKVITGEQSLNDTINPNSNPDSNVNIASDNAVDDAADSVVDNAVAASDDRKEENIASVVDNSDKPLQSDATEVKQNNDDTTEERKSDESTDDAVNVSALSSQNLGKFDIVLDCIGGKLAWDKARNILAMPTKAQRKANPNRGNGRFITLLGDLNVDSALEYGPMFEFGGRILNRKFWGAFGSYPEYHLYLVEPSLKYLNDILTMIENNNDSNGGIRPILDTRSPFEMKQVLEMIEISQSQSAHGKLVMQIRPENEPFDMVTPGLEREAAISMEEDKMASAADDDQRVAEQPQPQIEEDADKEEEVVKEEHDQ